MASMAETGKRSMSRNYSESNLHASESEISYPGNRSDSMQAKSDVFVGKKPLTTYVTSALIQLRSLPSITIKARGMTISRAVDVAQLIEKAGYSITKTTIGDELLSLKNQRYVSTIAIEIKPDD